jgi:hypothetical protein
MGKHCALALLVVALPAHAVDGAGLGLAEVVGVGVILLGAALPAVLLGASVFFLLWLVRGRKRDGAAASETADAQTPMHTLSTEDIELMSRWNIFFNGTAYRVDDQHYKSLPEALVAAQHRQSDR